MTMLEEEQESQSAKRAVEYEPPSRHYATRKQFRWLLILLLLNFAVTMQTAYWPALSSTIRTEIKEWRERRRARALQQQAMNWTEPAGKVVWDEDPQTAEKLLATPDYRPILVNYLQYIPNWPRGAHAVLPSPIDQFYRDRFNITYHHAFPNRSGERYVEADENALILMHNFKTRHNEDRLVYVYVQGKLDLTEMQGIGSSPSVDKPFTGTVARDLSIVALPCTIEAEDKVPIVLANEGAKLLIRQYRQSDQMRWSWTPPSGNSPEKITLGGEFFRFYAGQLDPSDPSHFIIPYELNNKKGIIHGTIKSNGQLELKPDSGKVVGSNWYPQQ